MAIWSCRKSILLVAFVLVVSIDIELVSAAKKAKGNPASTKYIELDPIRNTGQERFLCLGKSSTCLFRILVCPAQCPEQKPVKNKKFKGCLVDCSSKCETTCKYRKAKCDGYGSSCYDPRFVGGDGVMFYFHGMKGGDFALVSDNDFHINVHFIGTRPSNRKRDFTWVQAMSILFESHTLAIASKKVSTWDDQVEVMTLSWDGKVIVVPMDGDAEWRSYDNEFDENKEATERQVIVERTSNTNSVRVTIQGLLEVDVRVVPITPEEDRAHGYQLPADDVFAHLEMQFRFLGITKDIEGILGQTYRPNYVSPVKRGVPMPMMGGEDKYVTPSFLSTSCKVCRFSEPARLNNLHHEHIKIHGDHVSLDNTL